MHASITSYRRGALVIDVCPGESHSAAWMAVTGAAPQPRHDRRRPGRRQPPEIATRAARRAGASHHS